MVGSRVSNRATQDRDRKNQDYVDFLRGEDIQIAAILGKDAFASIPEIRRRYKAWRGYHNQVDTYYGRVRLSFGDSLPNIRRGGRVLDWGCGDGYTTIELANIYRNCVVIGIELREYLRGFIDYTVRMAKEDPGHLRMHIPPDLKRRVPVERNPVFPYKFVMADGFHAPFRKGTFDAVYCMNNLYYTLGTPEPGLARKRVQQVGGLVREGGHLLISGNNGGEDRKTFVIIEKNEGKLVLEQVNNNAPAGDKVAELRLRVLAEACG